MRRGATSTLSSGSRKWVQRSIPAISMVLVLLSNSVAFAQAGKIVFVSIRDGNEEIYIINDDGSNEHRLTNHPGLDRSPAISPDGTQIAFSSSRNGNLAEIFIMDIDGSNVTQITSGIPHDFIVADGVHWHPDGDKILFSLRTSSVWQLFQIGVDGSNLVQLTNGRPESHFARYGIDGSRIYLVRNTPFQGTTTSVWAADSNGGNLSQLTAQRCHNPDEVIENGFPIVVYYSRARQIFKTNLDGSGQQNISNNSFAESNARGPRGPGAGLQPNEIAFESRPRRAGLANIWRMRTDGTGAAQVTTVQGESPDWWVGLANRSPVAVAHADTPVECAGPHGAAVTLNGAASIDPDGDPLTFTWSGPFGQVGGSTADVIVTVHLALGQHTITLTVMDDSGGMSTDEVVVTIAADTTAPTVTAALQPIAKVDDDSSDDDDDSGKSDDDRSGDEDHLFQGVAQTTDACDSAPVVVADINGHAVQDGQRVVIKLSGGKDRVRIKHGLLEFHTRRAVLTVIATDAAGNGTAEQVVLEKSKDDDDDSSDD